MKHCWSILFFLPLLLLESDGLPSSGKNCTEFHKRDVTASKSEVCMRDLGCFKITDDFIDDSKRPLNVLPKNRRVINTQFLLYTKKDPSRSYILSGDDEDTLTNSPLNISLTTVFIIHGFLDMQYFATWMRTLKDELLKTDSNAIIVDWSGGNQLPYTQAVANTRVVGAEVAFLIGRMERVLGLSPKSCHIIGHSLGAHIAGYAGERLENLGRITALDPAAPYFEGMPPSTRIDPTDADFVDAIHTDMDSMVVIGLGIKHPVGHVDFYPNDGKDQPGCKTYHRILSIFTDGFLKGVRKTLSCSHQKSVDFFTASINHRQCLFTGYRCKDWNDFVNGKCTECGPNGKDCAVMGYLAEEHKPDEHPNNMFFLKTLAEAPYCAFHYQVVIHLKDGKNEGHEGKIKLIVPLEFDEAVTIQVNEKYVPLVPGTTITYMMTSPKEIHFSDSILFYWASSSFNLWDSHSLGVDKVTITPMDLMDQTTQESLILSYYPQSNPLIEMKNIELKLGD